MVLDWSEQLIERGVGQNGGTYLGHQTLMGINMDNHRGAISRLYINNRTRSGGTMILVYTLDFLSLDHSVIEL